jgi:capsular polysaccharide biosynthesis protein
VTLSDTRNGSGQSARKGRRYRNLLASVVAGIVVAFIVGLVGVAYAGTRPVQYQATASVVVLPAKNLDENGTISALDALSRGQVVDTFGRVLEGEGLLGPALQPLAGDGHDTSGVSVAFRPVSGTSIIDIVVTSPSAFVSEHVAAAIATASTTNQTSLQSLFEAHVVTQGFGSAKRTGAKTSTFILAFMIAALAAGIITQQLVMQLLSFGRVSWPESLSRRDRDLEDSTAALAWAPSRAGLEATRAGPPTLQAAPEPGPAPSPAADQSVASASAEPRAVAGLTGEAPQSLPAHSKPVESSRKKS